MEQAQGCSSGILGHIVPLLLSSEMSCDQGSKCQGKVQIRDLRLGWN